MEKHIDEIFQIGNSIPLPESRKIPIPVLIIGLINLLYFAYSTRETAIILQISGINLTFLVALLTSVSGFVCAIGLLFLNKLALLGFTLVWVINFGILIKIGYFNLWFFIASIIALIVIWCHFNSFEKKTIPPLESSQTTKIEDDTETNIVSESNHHTEDQITTLVSKMKIVIYDQTRTIKIKEKFIVVLLIIWSFIHTYLLLKSLNYPNNPFIVLKRYYPWYKDKAAMTKSDMFYPFTEWSGSVNSGDIDFYPKYFDVRFYDYSEYFIYAIGVWVVFFLYKYLRSTK